MGAQDRKSNTAVTFGMRNGLVFQQDTGFWLDFHNTPFYKENFL